ncbi:MAG: TIGR00296 family protein [Candidatus Bathyarchaeota archaeon]|nr:TIGR00296 family protein [Candidatus Bathyarchaeota archaeon]
MTFDLTLSEGTYLVKLARRTIEASFSRAKVDLSDAPPKTREVCGVFVTLNSLRGGEKQLRGCIGYPYPIKPLAEAVNDMAEAAAFEDPRFPRLTKKELGEIIIEVSVLTPPEAIKVEKPEQYPSCVKVGEHGLIAKRGGRSGLLLPQVATEWGWDSEEFLSQCCIKAGLAPDSWLLPGTQISSFKAIIFAEKTPGGEVEREEIQG